MEYLWFGTTLARRVFLYYLKYLINCSVPNYGTGTHISDCDGRGDGILQKPDLGKGNGGVRVDVGSFPSEIVALLHTEGDVDLLGPHWHPHSLPVLDTSRHRYLVIPSSINIRI